MARSPGLFSVLGPYSVEAEVRQGLLQATRIVEPGLQRHVALAFPSQGKQSAAARVVAEAIRTLARSWGDQLTPPAGKDGSVSTAPTAKRSGPRRKAAKSVRAR